MRGSGNRAQSARQPTTDPHRSHLAVGQAVPLCLRQILVTPGMRADRMSGRSHLLEYARLVRGMEADREKDGLGAVRGERGQDRRRVLWPRPVVESKHNLPFAQEVMRLEMLEAEAGATRGVDLDYARDTECIGITWTRRGHVRHRGGSWRRCGGVCRGRRRLRSYQLGRICDERW